ncbi:hypothetical protein [Arenibacterium halophilum]|uniref:hypothetical protein n=1 Tax=Arenibacterium halophilum TaxID=2583821 RepID=UPI00148702F7|nr:hypothetical protein [Arenibacterium halophilum]
MKAKSRFIASVVKESSKPTVDLPWARGARRAAMIARRNQSAQPPAKAARVG